MKREEAIDIIRKNIPHLGIGAAEMTEALNELIPELRESEDEKIRKKLIGIFTNRSLCDVYNLKSEDVLAYLEKQKEQIPYIDFVIKPHKGDDNNPYDMSVSEAQEYAIKRGVGIPLNDGEVFVDERYITQTIGNILRWADEHPKEQKPSWKPSEEHLEALKYFVDKNQSTAWAATGQWKEFTLLRELLNILVNLKFQ